MELGTSTWIASAKQAINTSDTYRERAAGWRWSLGLAFIGEGEGDSHYVVLDLHDGECRGAQEVDAETFQAASFRMAAPYARWQSLLSGGLDPMRCFVLKRIQLEGDVLTAMRYLPAFKAMIDALATIDAEAPAA